MFGVTLTLCCLGSGLPGAVCRGAPEESGPAGVTLLNLIGETKLTSAVDSNPIQSTLINTPAFYVSDIFNELSVSDLDMNK